MATLYITEYNQPAHNPSMPQASVEPPVTEQTVVISGGSTQSAAFNAATSLVRVHCDAICSVLVGQNPVATTSSQRFAANQTEYKVVPPGQGFKIAVCANV